MGLACCRPSSSSSPVDPSSTASEDPAPASSSSNPVPAIFGIHLSRPSNPAVASSLLKPPEEQSIILKTLTADVWESILDRLPAEDILSFMLTCGEAREIAMAFIGHFVSSDGRLQRLESLFEMPLLPSEKALRFKIEELRNDGVERPTLVHYKAVSMLAKSYECLRRENVFNADKFSHLDNSGHIRRVFDEQLDRDVIRLDDQAWWLYFHKTFRDVCPGKYEISLRMRLLPNFRVVGAKRLPNVTATRFGDYTESWTELSSLNMNKNCRCYIRHPHGSRRLNGAIRFDEDGNDWFWIILPTFHLKKTSSVFFQFSDTQFFSKSGMEWDIMQLKKLE